MDGNSNYITVIMRIPDEIADPSHEMGVTDAGYVEIVEALMGIGEDIDVRRGMR